MTGTTVNAIMAVIFPIAVLLGGGWALDRFSGRAAAFKQLTSEGHRIPRPLNMRWLGYGIESAWSYWVALQDHGRRAERTFLRFDLWFPFFYGGAFAASLWWVWPISKEPFPLIWIAVPILAIALIADWTENLIQLNQLGRYQDVPSSTGSLQGAWIRAASCATVIKLWFMSSLYVGLIGLVCTILWKGAP